jgi:hypothetical protein
MKNKNFKYLMLMFCIFCGFALSGCTKVEEFKIKMGLKNLDYEYIKENKVDKIVIQSTRDPGFRFIVTDSKTIKELYDILSVAKAAQEKSSLEPDYVFEMYEGEGTVHKFSYVTGLEKTEVGNLYNDDKKYIVSKRIDNDIIKNLWNLRKPREFANVYYGSFLQILKQYESEMNLNGKVGVVLSDDVEVAKYIFSMDLENFKADLKDKIPGAEIVSGNKEEYDVLITIKTLGYKTDKYRSMVTVYNKQEKSEKKYYSGCVHENGEWTIRVGTKAFEP